MYLTKWQNGGAYPQSDKNKNKQHYNSYSKVEYFRYTKDKASLSL